MQKETIRHVFVNRTDFALAQIDVYASKMCIAVRACGHLFLPLKSKSDLKLSLKFQFIRQVNQYSSKGKAKQNQLKFITTEDMILSSVI